MRTKRPNLGSLVTDFERLGAGTAVVATRGVRPVRYSYGELARLARRFARHLAGSGIQKGERVILCGVNGPEWVAAFFGCVLQGVLPVPLDAAGSPEFCSRVQAEVIPRLVVADADKASWFTGTVLPLARLPQQITDKPAVEVAGIKEEDALQIVFTSGTTGEPKGVVHTHRNVLASLEPIESEIGKYRKYERIFHPLRFLHTLPLSHVFGQFMGLWIPAAIGAEVHFEDRLVARDLIETIQRRRVSVLCCVPRVIGLLQDYAEQEFRSLTERVEGAAGISELKRWWRFRDVHAAFGYKFWAFVCGGAALAPELEQFFKRLGFVVVQGYGMTETTALVSLNHPFKPAQGTIGQVLPGREVKLGPDGEVLVRGATIADTVWQGGAARKRDGEWLATGDLAEFDQQGNLRFRSRKKDVIVTAAGLNIYPEDLESELRRAGARDAAVIEVAGIAGPEPMAVLLADSDAERIVEQANRKLAEFQRLHRWLVWPDADFPRTSTGKVLKRELQTFANGQLPGSSDEPLPSDSLGRVELQARVEQRYGVAIDESALQKIQTQAELKALIGRETAAQSEMGEKAPGHIYPHWPWNPVVAAIRTVFIHLLAMPLTRFLAAPRVERCITTLPREPFLAVANHITSYDVPFVLLALPRSQRARCAVAMSGEMLLDMRLGRNQGNWFLDFLAPFGYYLITGLFNVFPLPQKSGFNRSFRHAGEAMDRGYNVIVFPEGRRSDDGAPQPFMRGVGLLWKQLESPAVAVHLAGLGELKRRAGGWFRSGRIVTSLIAVLPAEESLDPARLTNKLRETVFAGSAKL